MNLERIVIGELIHCDKQTRLDSIIELQKIPFGEYQSLFNTIVELSLTNKDVDTVSLFQTNKEYSAGDISAIFHETVTDAYLPQHIYLLKSKKFKGELSKIINKSLKEIESGDFGEDLEEVKNSLIIELSSLTTDDKAEFDRISSYKSKIIDQLNSDRKIEGYSWGITDLDNWTSGIVIPRVYVLGGLKKSGKTRFLIQTLKFLHSQGVPTVFLSLEMPAYEVTKLLYSSMTGFNDLKFRAGSYLKQEERQEFERLNINEEILGLECRSGLNLEQILSRIRRYSKMGFKVICIDYIQRINHDRNKQAQELENISIKLADSARQHQVSLILLSQLNAMGEREAPNMGHLKGSGGIGESADTILLLDNLYRRTKKEEEKNKMQIICEQRHGDSGMLEIQMDLGACQFRNLIKADIEAQYNGIF